MHSKQIFCTRQSAPAGEKREEERPLCHQQLLKCQQHQEQLLCHQQQPGYLQRQEVVRTETADVDIGPVSSAGSTDTSETTAGKDAGAAKRDMKPAA